MPAGCFMYSTKHQVYWKLHLHLLGVEMWCHNIFHICHVIPLHWQPEGGAAWEVKVLFLVHLPRERDGRVESGAGTKLSSSRHRGTGSARRSWKNTQTTQFLLCSSVWWICEKKSYTDMQTLSLDTFLVFLYSLQRFKRSTQNWWLGKKKN